MDVGIETEKVIGIGRERGRDKRRDREREKVRGRVRERGRDKRREREREKEIGVV